MEVYFQVRRYAFIMHHLSRTVMLFSTIILGGIALTTSFDGKTNSETIFASEVLQKASTTSSATNLKPGVYDVTAYNYKTGGAYEPGTVPTQGNNGTESKFAKYFDSKQQVTINNDGTATITFHLDSKKIGLSSLYRYQVGPNLVQATFNKNNNTYTVTLPTSQLNGVIRTLILFSTADANGFQ